MTNEEKAREYTATKIKANPDAARWNTTTTYMSACEWKDKQFKKLVVWKLGSAHDAYVRSKPQDESYAKGKFDALDELYKELIKEE